MALDSIQLPKSFQAEYEGSIPFTRSIFFNDLARERFLTSGTGLNTSDNVFPVCSQRIAPSRPASTLTSVADQTLVRRFAMRFSCALSLPASFPCR